MTITEKEIKNTGMEHKQHTRKMGPSSPSYLQVRPRHRPATGV